MDARRPVDLLNNRGKRRSPVGDNFLVTASLALPCASMSRREARVRRVASEKNWLDVAGPIVGCMAHRFDWQVRGTKIKLA